MINVKKRKNIELNMLPKQFHIYVKAQCGSDDIQLPSSAQSCDGWALSLHGIEDNILVEILL